MNHLSETAMIVNLSISQWGASRQDNRITKEVAARHGSDSRMGRYTKHLIDPDALENVKRMANEARTLHREQSLPWADDGRRILPAANFLHYTELMRGARTRFEESVNQFLSHYPELHEQARIALNGLYDPADYPEESSLRGKFGFQVETEPLPNAQDFRVSINEEAAEAIRAEITHRTNENIRTAQRDLWERLREAVEHMHERIAGEDNKFRDSLVLNIRELVDLIPRLNLTQDPELDAIRAHVATSLAPQDPETLRKNKTIRKATADEAANILQRMAGYTGTSNAA